MDNAGRWDEDLTGSPTAVILPSALCLSVPPLSHLLSSDLLMSCPVGMCYAESACQCVMLTKS